MGGGGERVENGQNNPADQVLLKKLPKRSLSSFKISEFEALGSQGGSLSTEADDRFFFKPDYFVCDYLNFQEKIYLPCFPGSYF